MYHGSPRDEYITEFFRKTEDLFSESQHQVVSIVKKFTTSYVKLYGYHVYLFTYPIVLCILDVYV